MGLVLGCIQPTIHSKNFVFETSYLLFVLLVSSLPNHKVIAMFVCIVFSCDIIRLYSLMATTEYSDILLGITVLV